MRIATTFPSRREFETVRQGLDRLSLSYEAISPEPGYRLVGSPALAIEEETRMALADDGVADFVCSGWVEHRQAEIDVPGDEPETFEQDVFGRSVIMVLAPCVADRTKIRLIAHLSGDLTEAFPYLNAEMQEASYNAKAQTFTFLDRYRMVSLYPRRIAVAKADEIVDAWRTLEFIRRRVNDVWERRSQIEPSYEMRARPPALEIFKRLPQTNCKACGEKTCLAFALWVHSGEVPVKRCEPVFAGEFSHLKDALVEVCTGLGVAD